MSKTVVVNEEEFETLAEAIEDEEGWTVDESTITDLDEDVAVQVTDISAEKGQGVAEWLMIVLENHFRYHYQNQSYKKYPKVMILVKTGLFLQSRHYWILSTL